jgi:heterodisulfide reductase subunit A
MQLAQIIEQTRAYNCQNCGSCTALCPNARSGAESFSPRLLVNLALLDAADELLGSVWPCLTCGRCTASCPADVDLLLLVRLCREAALSAAGRREVRTAGKRVGVFLCHCGSNIASVVDVPQVAEHIRGLDEVACVETNFYTCSEDGLGRIQAAVRRHDLDRVVVASCTPRTHEALFRRACEGAGLNKYLFEFVNIREHCAWVHRASPAAATQKAAALVEMGVARALRLEPQQEVSVPVQGAALVVGGGPAGLSASLNLARQGFQVHLIEREAELGGMLRRLRSLYPAGRDAAEVLGPLVAAVQESPLISVHTGCELEAIEGQVGSFTATLGRNGGPLKVSAGTIIIATGAREAPRPQTIGRGPEVLTQLGLEERLREGQLPEGPVVMVLCVGARSDEAPACGKLCCQTAIKNAVLLKEAGRSVHVLHRDLMACGVEAEALYRTSQELGVRYARYSPDMLPTLRESPPAVEFRAPSLGRTVRLDAGLVVLSMPVAPAEGTPQLAQLLKVPVGQDGFFLEGHVKLRPVEFAAQGVFLCGSAKGPCHLNEAVAQGLAAAAKAASLMHPGQLVAEAVSAHVAEALCRGCGTCLSICPFGAVSLRVRQGLPVARVNEALCMGCGACAPACPSRAIGVRHFSDDQIGAALEAALRSAGAFLREGPASSAAA